MAPGLCRECVRLAWSNAVFSRIDRSTLRVVDTIAAIRSNAFAGIGCARLSSAKGLGLPAGYHREDERRVPDKEHEVHDDAVLEDVDCDVHYPVNLEDMNRNRSWRSALKQFKRRTDAREGETLVKEFGTNHCMFEARALPPAEDGETSQCSEGRNDSNDVNGRNESASTSGLDRVTATALNPEQLLVRNQRVAQVIEARLRERLNPKCSVGVFGSAINGLWTDASDLDICVQIPNVTSRSAIIRNLRRIAFLLEPLAPGRTFENRFTAKIPILHWKHGKPARKTGEPVIHSLGCSADISVNNVLAISNSALLGMYVACDPRVKSVVLALKRWARARDLNDRSKGTFGSFALSIMAIHFLQRCVPPIVVSLQDLAIADNEPPKYVSGIDVRFTTDMQRVKQELKWVCKGAENKMSVEELLEEFFYYFGWVYQKRPQTPICIRSVDFQYLDTSPTFTSRLAVFDMDEKFMHVDNPFEMGVDVANISFHQRNRVVRELRRAHRILKSGGSYDDICAIGDE
ncbi:poly(A) RNA polymerase GLD2 [Babesia caballi]|uniref:Poly(A) RNA polymerase GLD2 n=1 Tax=Babesia caballi TaxID=5871 RepID=A0AAV4M0H7_BABCB|nr:poly(A) RNA polymerase GLD2 [Babesia caballi]